MSTTTLTEITDADLDQLLIDLALICVCDGEGYYRPPMATGPDDTLPCPACTPDDDEQVPF